MVEHITDTDGVPGSNPGARTKIDMDVNFNEITIREPKITDLKQVLYYINKLSKEKTYITLQGEVIDEKSERVWLKSAIRKIQDKKAVYLFAFNKEQLIGISEVTMGTGCKEHVGRFGISIDKNFRGKGIGSVLMNTVLNVTKKLSKIRLICLEVFAENTTAIEMYKKKGFIVCGEIPKVLKRRGRYVNEILMFKEVK